MFPAKKVAKIITDRLILRCFKRSDAKIMFQNWCSDPMVTKYMLWETNTNINQTKKFVKDVIKNYQNNPYHWIIVNKATNIAIGSIGIGKIFYEEKKCEAGYCLSRKYWNKGIMTEAFKAVIAFLFHKEGFEEIVANHHIENIKSGKVMLKCGMKYIDTSDLYNKIKDEYIKVHNYSIKKSCNA